MSQEVQLDRWQWDRIIEAFSGLQSSLDRIADHLAPTTAASSDEPKPPEGFEHFMAGIQYARQQFLAHGQWRTIHDMDKALSWWCAACSQNNSFYTSSCGRCGSPRKLG